MTTVHRSAGPVECAVAGHRAAGAYLVTLVKGCSRGNELFAGLRAVELAYGDEGARAYLRTIQKALETVCAKSAPDGADLL